jgi:hypothetical protein
MTVRFSTAEWHSARSICAFDSQRYDDMVTLLQQKGHSDRAHIMAALVTLHSERCGIYDLYP